MFNDIPAPQQFVRIFSFKILKVWKCLVCSSTRDTVTWTQPGYFLLQMYSKFTRLKCGCWFQVCLCWMDVLSDIQIFVGLTIIAFLWWKNFMQKKVRKCFVERKKQQKMASLPPPPPKFWVQMTNELRWSDLGERNHICWRKNMENNFRFYTNERCPQSPIIHGPPLLYHLFSFPPTNHHL